MSQMVRMALMLLGGVVVGLGLWMGLQGLNAPESAEDQAAPSPGGAQQVVVLDPGVHELMIRLGATDRMVGRADYTDEFSQTAHLPTMGTGLSPNYERIVQSSPDLILSTHASRGVVLDNLKKIAPTENLPWLTAAEVSRSVRSVGTLLGMEEEAGEVADELESGLAPAITAESPRVLVLLGAPTAARSDLWVVKPNSLHGAALEAAGGKHAIPEEIAGPPTLSIEGLLQTDPDIILVLIAEVDISEEAMAVHRSFWTRFPMLSAVKHERIGFMVGRTHFYTGPGVLEFKRALAEKIAEVQGRGP